MSILNKGAIPRITQEIYYTTSSDGSKEVNVKLTLIEFKERLDKINTKEKVRNERLKQPMTALQRIRKNKMKSLHMNGGEYNE
jgi:hypothetical protein